MIFTGIKGITIPEGAVKQIADGAGRILWKGGAVDVAALAIGYTGDYTDQADVVMSGKTYRLLTLTGSGTLTLAASVKADVWLCAGGNGGRYAGYHGGGGGNFVQSDGLQLAASTVCTIGAGAAGTSSKNEGIGGTTTFGALEAVQATGDYASKDGASGGGAGARGSSSTAHKGPGGGMSTVPFLETALFDPHSAGGGGGGYRDREEESEYAGGAGGSDGAGGASRSSGGFTGGAGGNKGGGDGAKATSTSPDGNDATFYGSGGGGGARYVSTSGNDTSGDGGAGYQGVIYVRIPYEQ